MMKKMVFTVMFAAVLSASGLSIRQLRALATPPACGSPCEKTVGCQKPCLCFVSGFGTSGVCQPEGPPPAPDALHK
jgi:hypothetical protein